MDLCWWDIETLSLCGLMWKRFQRVSQSLVHEIKRTRWRIKQISLSLSLWLLCSSCEAVGGSHLCLFCLLRCRDGWRWCFHWVRGRASRAAGVPAERGVSAACYASERGVTQLCVEFYSPPFLFLFVFLFRVHAEFERGATWTYPRLLCSSLPFFCKNMKRARALKDGSKCHGLRFVCKKVYSPLLRPSTRPWMFVTFRKPLFRNYGWIKTLLRCLCLEVFVSRFLYAVISLCSSVIQCFNLQTYWVVRLLTLFVLKSCRNQNSSWKVFILFDVCGDAGSLAKVHRSDVWSVFNSTMEDRKASLLSVIAENKSF